MASRLSENSIKASYDAGHAGVAWTPPKAGENLMRVDFTRMLAQPDATEAIQALPPQLVYHALKLGGAEVAAEVVPHISQEQLTKIMDYDSWPADVFDGAKMLPWLRCFKANGPEGMAENYRALDEVYQISMMRQFVRVYDEEQMEAMTDDARDDLIPMPGNQIFYTIDTEDREVFDSINDLIQSAQALDMGYALSLLAFSTWAVPNENEAVLKQFRDARLEEDGFVTYEESLKAFSRVDVDELVHKWKQSEKAASNPLPATITREEGGDESYFDKAVIYGLSTDQWLDTDAIDLQQRMLHLANSVCAAARVESDDLVGLNRILEQLKALISLGLDSVSEGNLALALEVIKNEAPKQLFRAGLSALYDVQIKVLGELKKFGVDVARLEKLHAAQKWGQILWLLDTDYRPKIGFENSEVLKALFNRFPMRPYIDNTEETARLKFKPIDSVVSLNYLKDFLNELYRELGNKN